MSHELNVVSARPWSALRRRIETNSGLAMIPHLLLGLDGYEPHKLGERQDQFPWHLGLDALQSAM